MPLPPQHLEIQLGGRTPLGGTPPGAGPGGLLWPLPVSYVCCRYVGALGVSGRALPLALTQLSIHFRYLCRTALGSALVAVVEGTLSRPC